MRKIRRTSQQRKINDFRDKKLPWNQEEKSKHLQEQLLQKRWDNMYCSIKWKANELSFIILLLYEQKIKCHNQHHINEKHIHKPFQTLWWLTNLQNWGLKTWLWWPYGPWPPSRLQTCRRTTLRRWKASDCEDHYVASGIQQGSEIGRMRLVCC